jgi:hypothetical protein
MAAMRCLLPLHAPDLDVLRERELIVVVTFAEGPLSGLSRIMELRIDVPPLPPWLTGGFETLYDRIYRHGDRLYSLPRIRMDDPQFEIHVREADGEFYLYVEDLSRACLAGYTVFNRMVELERRADWHVRAPHSRYLPRYQRRGLASAVYKWALEKGFCLITGARQSAGAHALWLALGKHYELGYVDLRDKIITDLGKEVSPAILGELQTRMLMLGAGWTTDRFCEVAGMRPLPPG